MVFFLAQHTFMRLDSKAKGYKIENGFQFMNHKKIYRTNQKETVLNYIQNYPQAHFTAADLFASLKQEGYNSTEEFKERLHTEILRKNQEGQ